MARKAKIEKRNLSFGDNAGSAKKPEQQSRVVEINDEFESIPISKIVIEKNVRKNYPDESIKELADSIKSVGLLQPIKVYDKGSEYAIVFGHRRFLACKEAGFTSIKAIIGKKPESLENIYIQLIENEQKENLSHPELEEYVNLLKKKYNQSVEDIAKRMGKSTIYIYKIIEAKKTREEKEHVFVDAGIPMTTRDAMLVKNANLDDLKDAVNEIVENPSTKTKVLDDLQKKSIKNKNMSKAKKTIENKNKDKESLSDNDYSLDDGLPSNDYEEPQNQNSYEDESTDNVLTDNCKSMKLEVDIIINTDQMTVSFKPKMMGSTYREDVIPSVVDNLTNLFQNDGYTIEK